MDVMKTDWSNEHASCKVTQNPDIPAHMDRVREISSVWTDPEHRKQGFATELMKAVTDEADILGIVLILQPKEFGKSDGLKDLISWYKRFGFVKTQNNPVLMARAPEFRATIKETAYAIGLQRG